MFIVHVREIMKGSHLMLKKVIPLDGKQLLRVEIARKKVKDAEQELYNILKDIEKPYKDKYTYPWSVTIDGGFILIRRYDG